jgi:putative tryptophan/tyrosine transport system substrate-binding protein
MHFHQWKRREFITLLGGAAVAWPPAARAQRTGKPLIGFLHQASPENYAGFVASFRKGLGESSKVDGQNVAIEYRWADGHYDRLPGLAAELVRRPVTAICAAYLPAALAAKAATTAIPIVFVVGSDPIDAGLVAALNRPGGNVTGVTQFTAALIGKRLELLRELVPNASLIGVLMNTDNPNAEINTKEVQAAAQALGLQIQIADFSVARGFESAFGALSRQGVGALLVSPDAFFQSRLVEIAILAARHAIPAIHSSRESAAAGGLASYGASMAEASQQAGAYVGRILKGERPGDLPVIQPSKFEFIINLRTARALGLHISPTLLTRADEVIE